MPSTYTLIKGETLTGSAASYTFTAIPGTFTDLVMRWSGRSDTASGYQNAKITLNGLTSGSVTSQTWLQNLGGTAGSSRYDTTAFGYFWTRFYTGTGDFTSNTFSSHELYLPNYTSSTSKPSSVISVAENNTTDPYLLSAFANLTTTASAINQIAVATTSGNFVAGSSFYLYGIKNS